MASKFMNLDTDNTLGGASASDEKVPSQKAVKKYVDDHAGGTPSFASITGQPTDNTNLANALAAKEDTTNKTQSIDGNSTTTEYPSAKAVWDLIQNFKYME